MTWTQLQAAARGRANLTSAPLASRRPAWDQEAQAAIAAWSAGLNEGQRSAFLHDDGAALAIAGAGVGKTRVLTHRIARLLLEGKAKPSQILALTFTRDAAAEMKGRVGELLAPFPGLQTPGWIHTFHAAVARLANSPLPGFDTNPILTQLGVTAGYKVLDAAQDKRARELLVAAMEAADLETEPSNDEPDPVAACATGLSALKGWLATPETAVDVARNEVEKLVERGLAPPAGIPQAIAVYEQHRAMLQAENACDFDDLVIR